MGENQVKRVHMPGRLVIVGFGSIGQGTLPLILTHFDLSPSNITIVTAEESGKDKADHYGIRFIQKALTINNYRTVLEPLLSEGDFLLNLSVNVSSLALIDLCQEKNVLYLDTCIEPWQGGYFDQKLSIEQRSNYALREQALAFSKKGDHLSTAVVAHGVNPGMVSHFVKQALLNIAKEVYGTVETPATREGWGKLAQKLGIKVIHIAERDTQFSLNKKKPGEFVNTWSVDGFIGEGCQPAELGWGTHERHWPNDAYQHSNGCGAAIYLNRPGASVRIRTWTPETGPFHGFLITHNEAISIADYLTLSDADGKALYRPTCHYAYHPCDDAVVSIHELAGRKWIPQKHYRLIVDDVVGGYDELGVLLMGHSKGAYWYGSHLSAEKARQLVPYNNATSLQVSASVLAGMVWAVENPRCGVVEADTMDFERCMEVAAPYLGVVRGEYSDWTPLEGRDVLFREDLDVSDPWQFKNFRVV